MILPDSLDQIQEFETANSFLIKQMVSVLLVFAQIDDIHTFWGRRFISDYQMTSITICNCVCIAETSNFDTVGIAFANATK